MANGEQSVPYGEQGGAWLLTDGDPSPHVEHPKAYRPDGTENLTHSPGVAH